jgi:hypothetical protein
MIVKYVYCLALSPHFYFSGRRKDYRSAFISSLTGTLPEEATAEE